MKLASYATARDSTVRIGALVEAGPARCLVDLAAVYARIAMRPDGAPVSLPGDMRLLLDMGEPGLDGVRRAVAFATSEIKKPSTLSAWRSERLIHDEESVRLLAPVPRPGKIIAVGSNYKSHVTEAGPASKNLPAARAEKHTWPAAFAKFPSVVVGHKHAIVYSRHTTQLDYEAELCVIIGRRCKDISEADVDGVVAGYTIANDVSMRDLQFAEMRRGLILLGKNLDTTSPMGPYLVTKDEIPDPQNLQIKCWVNGDLRQHDSTANMTFSVRELVSYFSRTTLEPGDIIATGTPAGVGIFSNPPEAALLRVGDTIDIEIAPIGRLSNSVIAEGA